MNQPHHRSLRSRVPQKMFSAFLILREGGFFLKRKGHFSLVFCPPSIRAVRGASIRTKFWQNYFLGIWIWQNRDCISRPQKGVWGMNAVGFGFQKIGGLWFQKTEKNDKLR